MAIDNSIIGKLNRIEGKIKLLLKRCKNCG